ncbi:hypothetical protein [Sphingopyxis sp.]|uniref:phosphotriesterase family protein n=1 Tax=Sphingopyxis sp. TaxID=1908224 RepID=UPI002D76D10A|nr:hypothetical protein [Sphingopyxis sp.]HET6522886.1 hypothetical protein [Sphingopyxis sp.]
MTNSGSVQYHDLTIPDMSGKVLTVLGPIEPEQLGTTLMHEHMIFDFGVNRPDFFKPHFWSHTFQKPYPGDEQVELLLKNWDTRINLENGYKLMNYQDFNFFIRDEFWCRDDIDDAVEEMLAFKSLGGKTVVDQTPTDLGRDPEKLREISVATDMHVVMGTGSFLLAPNNPAGKPIDEITYAMVRDVAMGVGENKIRAGLLGEICGGVCEHDDTELTFLRAAARASRLTGAALSIHTDSEQNGNRHHSVLDVIEEEGGDLTRVIICHISATECEDLDFLEGLMRRGAILSFDHIGYPLTWHTKAYDQKEMADGIIALIRRGYASQIIVGQDTAPKDTLRKYGGRGFTYIQEKLLPYMKSKGVSEAAITTLMVTNPQRILALVPPQPLGGKG